MPQIFFKYVHGKLSCRKCNKVIQAGDLQIDYGVKGNHSHFQCSLDTCSFDDCQKENIEIFIRSNFDETRKESLFTLVSLEVYDQNPDDYQISINATDLTKIREQIALAKEHKTKFFIPSVSTVSRVNCHQKCQAKSNHTDSAQQLQLHFQGETYHPLCLLEAGKVNLDAKEFFGYKNLTKNQRQYLNKLFKKDQVAYYFPTAQRKSAHLEYCSFSKCLRSRTNPLINGLRIQYKTKSYHPVCFAAMGIVNIDGEKIGNYYSLTDNQKEFFVNNFKKSDDFDIPVIEYAKCGGYCNMPKCLHAEAPSKFPWPYTITKNELQIKFHGTFYHLECFQSTNKVNMAVKDFYGYNELDDENKQALDEIFVRNAVVDASVDGDNGEDLGQQHNAQRGNDNQETKAKIEVKQEESENGQEDTVSPNNGLQLAGLESDDQNLNMVTALSEDIEMQEFDYDVVAIDGTENQPSELQPSITDGFVDGNIIDGRLDSNDLKRNAEDAIVNIDTDDDDDVFVIEPPPAKKIKLESKTEVKMETNDQLNNEEPTGNITLFKYETPNDAFVKSVLEKFQIPINKQALLFWINVSYTVFTATSTPTSTFDISSPYDSFFKSLSCFFTGKEEKFLSIKRAIQAYFFNNFKTLGTINGIDFSNLDTTSNYFDEFYECTQLSNIHYNFICSWLKCRIGIFSPGENGLQKYGSWEEEDRPILLIQNENGFYKPVLTLI